MEVYAALYDPGLKEMSPVEAVVLEAQSFKAWLNQQPVCFFGTGSDKAAEMIDHPNAHFFTGMELSATYQSEPAERLYHKNEFLDTAYFEPHYLKEFIASIPKNKVLG
jgi:tRNA threonylcarbamoyladenosine biosynthesis protein TsaB